MPDRPLDQPDVNPARVAGDPLLAEIAALVAYLDLHLGRYHWSQLTTRQKELLADLVDANHVLDPSDPEAGAWFVPRWWREDFNEGAAQADDWTAPDPFVYRDQGGDRDREPVGHEEPDQGALAVARFAVLAAFQPDHPERVWVAEDLVAVYEWARRSVVPVRMSAGDRVGQIGSLVAYPTPAAAAAFLDGYRAARRDRWERP